MVILVTLQPSEVTATPQGKIITKTRKDENKCRFFLSFAFSFFRAFVIKKEFIV